MAQISWPWPDTSDPGPTIGDGRKITAEEYAAKMLHAFGRGVLPFDNMLTMTTTGANKLRVDTGSAIVQGRFYRNDASVTLMPASAGPGLTRKDSVVLECDWDGSGATGQYTVRVITLAGTSVSYPALTQIPNVRWQDELYRYTISDAGVISDIIDMRTLCTFNTKVSTAMLLDGILSADAAGRAKMAAGFFGKDTDSRAKFQNNFFDATTALAKFDTNSITNSVLLKVIQDGAFQADASTRALFADRFVTRAKLNDGSACSVIGRSANSSGAVADIAASSNGAVLRRAADSLGFGQIGADSLESGINAQPKAFNADSVDGLHATDILAGGVIQGAIIMWSGTLGGSDGHRPIVGGVANEDWHLCNGEVVGSVPTPDLRDRFVVGAGSTYTKGATGGATTANHSHSAGTYKTPSLSHVLSAPGSDVLCTTHTVTLEDHSPEAITGTSGAATPSILPPYYAVYYIMKVA